MEGCRVGQGAGGLGEWYRGSLCIRSYDFKLIYNYLTIEKLTTGETIQFLSFQSF